MRVLIVENDGALGLFLQRGLKLEGHDVALVTDGQRGLDYVMENAPDLMVLDLSLPKMDGMQVLEGLTGCLTRTSVIVLTGRSGLEERLRCLDLGADDCLSKPFSFSELTARCKALGRRRMQIVDTTLRHRGIELNRMDRRVMRDGQLIELTGKEFALLEYLMQARGRCCSRSELLREVWQMSPDAGTNVVDVYINYLRKKLGMTCPPGSDDSEQVIVTLRGAGYMMSMGAERKLPARSLPRVASPVEQVRMHVPGRVSMSGPSGGAAGLGLGSRYIA